MHIVFDFLGLHIPAYGLFITIGVACANIVVFFFCKRDHNDFDNIILIEAYCFLGGFLGSKLLFVIVSFNEIDWGKLSDFREFSLFMQSGFVFYGGLAGGVLAILLAGKIHGFDAFCYIRNYIFALPLAHGFGRIGCFLAGCCYGKEYHGLFAVVFPEYSFAPAGIELFPVQLFEAAALFVIAVILIVLKIKHLTRFAVEVYMLLYGFIRFILEFYRADSYRGIYFGLSTSQWISLIIILLATVFIIIKKNSPSAPKTLVPE